MSNLAGGTVDVLHARDGTCRDRLRQVLEPLDGGVSLPVDDLMALVTGSRCQAAHELHYASLMDGFVEVGAGMCQLGPRGSEWLLRNARPAPDWRSAPAHVPPLRAWQVEALDAWAHHGRLGVVEAVTGTGKSRVGIEAAREALGHDYTVVVVVPTRDLVDQWEASLRAAGIHGVGIVGEGWRGGFGRHRVLVGTVQSFYRNPPTRDDGKVLLIADECHRYGAGQWRRALHPSNRRRLGLTATFERNDDGLASLLDYFGGTPLFRIGFDRAIAEGVVARYRVKLHGVVLQPQERRAYDEAHESVVDCRTGLVNAGFPAEPFGLFLQQVQEAAEDKYGGEDPTVVDLARRYLKAFSERIKIMSSAAGKMDAVRAVAPRVQASAGALLFTRTVEAADEIAEVLNEAGVACEAIHSRLTRPQRRQRLSDLRIKRLKAIAAPTVLDEGVDVPAIDLAVVLGGSKSRRQMIQRMGRVLRVKADGGHATFIVVYAQNTVEDLTQNDGQEGCLDLVMASADAVEHVNEAELGCDAEGTLPVRKAVEVSESRNNARDTQDLRRRLREPRAWREVPWPIGSDAHKVQRALMPYGPLELFEIRPSAVLAYCDAHPGTDADTALPDLKRLLQDLDIDRDRCHIKNDKVWLGRSGYTVTVLPAAREVSAYDPTGQRQTYGEYRANGRSAEVVNYIPRATPAFGTPVDVDSPHLLMRLVDLSAVPYTRGTLDRLARDLDDGYVNDWDLDRLIRSQLARDVATATSVTRTAKGGHVVRGETVQWTFRSDCGSVKGEPLVSGEAVSAGPEHSSVDVVLATDFVPESPATSGNAGDAQGEDHLEDDTLDQGQGSCSATSAADEREGEQTESLVGAVDIASQLERLTALHLAGHLDAEEFAAAKAKVLA